MHPVVRKLRQFSEFSSTEVHALQLALGQTMQVPARSSVLHEDDRPMHMYFLLSGFCYRQRSLANGRRQILSFMLSGDACDIGVTLLDRRDHAVVAATDSTFARVSGPAMDQISAEYPRVGAALRWANLVDESISREWIINLGQRSAEARTAHLICETYYRTEAIGLNRNLSFPLPLAQSDLADALGISSVHANRTIQELRRKELISFSGGWMTILNLDELLEVAAFDPVYLHRSSGYSAPNITLPRA